MLNIVGEEGESVAPLALQRLRALGHSYGYCKRCVAWFQRERERERERESRLHSEEGYLASLARATVAPLVANACRVGGLLIGCSGWCGYR